MGMKVYKNLNIACKKLQKGINVIMKKGTKSTCNGWPAGGKMRIESVTGERRACSRWLTVRGAQAGLRPRVGLW